MNYPEVDISVVQAASERGIAHASWMMSVLYRISISCERSDSKSIDYLKTAVAQGSMRAKRDLALRALAGSIPDLHQKRAYAMMVELVDAGFDRSGLGEKLILSGIPLLVRKGYEALRICGFQERRLRPRFFTSLYEAHDGVIPDAREMQFFLTYYRFNRAGGKAVHRALLLADVVGVGNPFRRSFEVAENLLHVGSAEACIDALDILDCTGVKEKDIDLKIKTFKQLEAHALKGDPQSQVLYTAELLDDAHPRDKAPLALKLIELLSEFPQFHRDNFDGLIHSAKSEDASIAKAHSELAHKLVSSGLCPLAHRSLGIELMHAEKPEAALEHFVRAVELDVDYAIKNLVSWYGQRYAEYGDNYEDTRFWHEALMFESPHMGVELAATLLEVRKGKSGLTHKETLTRKTCLEILSAADDAESTRELAMLILKGDGPVLAEPKRAVALLEKAAQTDGRAMYELAHMYMNGIHVPNDLYLAQRYFDEAAKSGHSNAIYDTVRAELSAAKEEPPEPNNIVNLDELPLSGDIA
jgi:TPR repeat protein